MKMSRIMIAGTGSGSGKTTITCGILNGLKRRGMKIGAWKCGPDYIDTMFHSRVLGLPTGNLDSFFCDKETLQYLVKEKAMDVDISVIEGVMGYFDGVGFTENGSSAEIAEWTKTPVILVVNGAGMSRSIEAILRGFQEMDQARQIRGVIFNRVSEGVYCEVAKIAWKLGIVPLGYVPKQKNFELQSRHLGLVTASEIKNFQEQLDLFSERLEQTLDFEQLLQIAECAEILKTENELEDIKTFQEKDSKTVTIAVAKDEAFCFLYEDNLSLLKKLGCEIRFFSPMRSEKLPPNTAALWLGGGYPELYAKELSENRRMKEAVREAIQKGMPLIAECGGFLYLHKQLEDKQHVYYPMVKIWNENGIYGDRLRRFGYITMQAEIDGMLAKKGDYLKAHEFHYWESENPGSDFLARKPGNGREWMAAHHTTTSYAGFPHFYLYGNRKAAFLFVEAARAFQQSVFEKE